MSTGATFDTGVPGALPPAWPGRAGAAAPPTTPESSVAFGALMAFTFVLLFAPQVEWAPALAAVRPALLLAVIGIAAAVLDAVARGAPLVAASRELTLALGLLGWAVVTMPLSYWPGGSLAFLAEMFGKSLAIFWLIGQTVTTTARARRLAWLLGVLAALAAIEGMRNYLGQVALVEGQARIAGYQAAGLTKNPNDLAFVINLALPLVVALLVSSRGLARTALGGVAATLVAGIVVTFSRSGFLTLATTAGVYLWRLQRRAPWALLVVPLVVLLVLPLLPGGYLERLGTMLDFKRDRTGSAEERWSDLVVALAYLATHPVVGAGLGQGILALNEVRGESWRAIHNMYLEYGVELGVPGLALFVLLLVGSVRNAGLAARQAARAGDAALAHLADGLRLSLIAFAVGACFSPGGYHFPFYYLAGLALAVRRLAEPR